MIKCPICETELSKIDKQHLKKHSLTFDEYILRYGKDAPFGYSEELKLKKSGDNHPFKGHKRSEEQRKNISAGIKKLWDEGKVSAKQINAIGIRSRLAKENGNHFNLGRKYERTDEYKEKLSKALLEYYKKFPKSKYIGDNDRYNKQLLHIQKLAESTKLKTKNNLLNKLENNFSNVNLLINNRILCNCKKCNTLLNYSLDTFEKYSFNNTICHKCNPRQKGYSKGELDLFNFILSLCPDAIHGNKNIIKNGLELDIFVPSKNIAFEYNGLYWHSDLYKDKQYHLNKTEECEKLGIQLIHIFEDEWEYKNELIKEKIKHVLNLNNNKKYYARECEVKELPFKDVKNFLNDYHIQGNGVKTKINLGLFYDDLLVGVMTFGNLRKNLNSKSKDGHYELIRFCTKDNVIGAGGKLFSYMVKKFNPKYIVSYADRRWSSLLNVENSLYYKLGFKLDHISKPGYFYTDFVKRYNRFGFRKPKTDLLINEAQFWEKYGFRRIWDCGNLVFVKYFE
jgi:hypothetical protein